MAARLEDGGSVEQSSSARDYDSQYRQVSEVFAALASPLRAAIIHRLTRREHSVAELVDELGAAQPLISQHLSRLRYARLVDGERRGRQVVYRITDDHVAHIFLDAYRHSSESRPSRDQRPSSADRLRGHHEPAPDLTELGREAVQAIDQGCQRRP